MAHPSRAPFVAAAVTAFVAVGVSVYFVLARKLHRRGRCCQDADGGEGRGEQGDDGSFNGERGSASSCKVASNADLNIRIFFGSETGTAERMSEDLAEDLQESVAGSAVSVYDLEVG